MLNLENETKKIPVSPDFRPQSLLFLVTWPARLQRKNEGIWGRLFTLSRKGWTVLFWGADGWAIAKKILHSKRRGKIHAQQAKGEAAPSKRWKKFFYKDNKEKNPSTEKLPNPPPPPEK